MKIRGSHKADDAYLHKKIVVEGHSRHLAILIARKNPTIVPVLYNVLHGITRHPVNHRWCIIDLAVRNQCTFQQKSHYSLHFSRVAYECKN